MIEFICVALCVMAGLLAFVCTYLYHINNNLVEFGTLVGNGMVERAKWEAKLQATKMETELRDRQWSMKS